MTRVLEAVEQAETWNRDQKAWNTPRRRARTDAHTIRAAPTQGLDWEGFSARYFPGWRRHDFEALVAYAAYKRGSPGSEKMDLATERIESGPLEAWENEGGRA